MRFRHCRTAGTAPIGCPCELCCHLPRVYFLLGDVNAPPFSFRGPLPRFAARGTARTGDIVADPLQCRFRGPGPEAARLLLQGEGGGEGEFRGESEGEDGRETSPSP
jgi:hypothetical protein